MERTNGVDIVDYSANIVKEVGGVVLNSPHPFWLDIVMYYCFRGE